MSSDFYEYDEEEDEMQYNLDHTTEHILDDEEDEEETIECPVCMEELDATDRQFKPCKCGYQVKCVTLPTLHTSLFIIIFTIMFSYLSYSHRVGLVLHYCILISCFYFL